MGVVGSTVLRSGDTNCADTTVMGGAVVSIRINSWIKLVGKVGRVRASVGGGCVGGASVTGVIVVACYSACGMSLVGAGRRVTKASLRRSVCSGS